ncbi:MAG: hypothetical protein ACOXZV_00645 [Bacteroidales bacterium]|jgi:hypothetical protein
MKIIDRLLLKFGYIKKSKLDLQMLRMEYTLPYELFANTVMPETFEEIEHKRQLKKFLEQVEPFIEKRIQRTCSKSAYLIDVHKYELRLFVAKPKNK